MDKNILVLGGSYFVGRVFSLLSARRDDITLHVVNRGNYRLSLLNVQEYVCDRHDCDRLARMLPNIPFDAAVDFCGYKAGEIERIVEALGGRIGQYVFFSTISICDPSIQNPKTECSPLADLHSCSTHPVMDYLYQKAVLETELRACCASRRIPWTIFRPSFIYGPFNYAPRESYFIKCIAEGLPVPFPEDASAEFSMVYVEDAAQAVHTVIGEPAAHDRVFNLAAPELITYARLFNELRVCHGAPFPIQPVSIAEVNRDGIPLPFPLDTNDLTDGSLLSDLFDFRYTSFSEGFARTYKAFSKVYM
jgi:2'-hydroxyisoflavone reductase